MPTENKLTEPLAYVSEISRFVEQEILRSAGAICNLPHEFLLDSEVDPIELCFQFESSVIIPSRKQIPIDPRKD